jgi:hypothetical protein
MEGSVKQQVDQLLQEVTSYGLRGQEHAEIDRRQEVFDHQVSVESGRQFSCGNAPSDQDRTHIKSLSPEALDLVEDLG